MRLLPVLLVACNFAPLEWNDYGNAPGAIAGWGGPTEICGPDLISPGDLYVDGFYLCLTENDLIPVDDPLLIPCDEDPVDQVGDAILPKDEVFYVYDGVRARGYPLEWMRKREAVHDMMGRVPVLVDW